METTIGIKGMMCAHCQARMKKALEKLPGVEAVEVSLEKAQATLRSQAPLSEPLLRKAVEDAGYEMT